MEAKVVADPEEAHRLDRARGRRQEYIARRADLGDPSTKRARVGEQQGDVELESRPPESSESRHEGEDQQRPRGDPGGAESEGGSTRVEADVDVPIPAAEDRDEEEENAPKRARVEMPSSRSTASSSRDAGKRKHEGPVGDEGRAEDPEDPVEEAGMLEESVVAPKIFMLGERRRKAGRLGEGLHLGKYELCELFSPPRVVSVANSEGLRGGWSLDLNHRDPVTGSEWDLSDAATQEKVWKMVRRDKPLVIGLSPECTLSSQLQNLRKTMIPPEDMARAVECVQFCVRIANYQRKAGRYFLL